MRAQSFLASLLSLVWLIGCGGGEPQEQAAVARPVKLLTLGAAAGAGSLEYAGAVQASQSAQVAFEVPGRLVELRVDEGQAVRQGAVLARLDARDFEAQRDAEVARLNQARAEHARYQELYASDAVSLQELEERRRSVDVLDARVRTAEKAVQDTRLRAPFAGTVARRLVENFENVQAKQPVVELQDESGLEVVVNVPENDMAVAVPGLSPEERTARVRPQVEVSSLPGRRFSARIKEFAATADPVTRTFRLTVAFDPPADVSIRSGMTAKVIATVQGEASDAPNRFLIPANAVAADENGDPYVWKVDEATMTVNRQPVGVGQLQGDEIEVLRGLAAGDVIAVSGVHNLRDGLLVRRLEN